MLDEFFGGFLHGLGEVLATVIIGYLCVRNREKILRAIGKMFRGVTVLMKYVLLLLLAGIILWGGYEGYKHLPKSSDTSAPAPPQPVEPQREDAQTQYQRGNEFYNAKRLYLRILDRYYLGILEVHESHSLVKLVDKLELLFGYKLSLCLKACKHDR